MENVPRPGVEEQLDNEKNEFRPRDYSAGESSGIARLLGSLNAIRRVHPALRQLQNVRVHPTENDSLVCFSRPLAAEHSPTARADVVIVVVNLDPWNTQECLVHLDLAALGLPVDAPFVVRDELGGTTHTWHADNFVRLAPSVGCAHVMSTGQA